MSVSTPSVAEAAPADNLSLPLVLSFVSATIPAAVLLGMLGVFLPRYFATLGLSLFAGGGVSSLGRLVDPFAVYLPLGWLMDKTTTPIGRYKPWYIAGVPILSL